MEEGKIKTKYDAFYNDFGSSILKRAASVSAHELSVKPERAGAVCVCMCVHMCIRVFTGTHTCLFTSVSEDVSEHLLCERHWGGRLGGSVG